MELLECEDLNIYIVFPTYINRKSIEELKLFIEYIFKVVNKLIVSLKLLTLFLCQEQVRQEIYFCLFVFGPFCMLEL